MRVRELIERYTGPGGVLYLDGADLPAGEVPTRVEIADPDHARTVQPADLLLVRMATGIEIRSCLPTAPLPVGTHVVLLLDADVSKLPVARLLTALSGIGLQVVAASPVSSFTDPTTAVIGLRTDTSVVPPAPLSEDLSLGPRSDDDRLRRILGEHTMDSLIFRARERTLHDELKAARGAVDRAAGELRQVEAVAAELPAVRAELERQRNRVSQIETSQSYRLARQLSRSARRVRHPFGIGSNGSKSTTADAP